MASVGRGQTLLLVCYDERNESSINTTHYEYSYVLGIGWSRSNQKIQTVNQYGSTVTSLLEEPVLGLT